VAIGRAIVRAPKVFLFDEPLSNLDAALRGQTRVEIARLHANLGATTIYVTHDQIEAMTLADRVVVLRDGQIEQVGTPLELYDRPANQFVAQFIGTPQMNVVALAAAPEIAQLPMVQQWLRQQPDMRAIGLRPEAVQVGALDPCDLNAQVVLVEALGAETLVYVNTASGLQLTARQSTRSLLKVGDRVGVSLDGSAAHCFDTQGRVLQVQREPASRVA
jgi:multiple sugar transport system ATP-binding protein